MGEKLTVILWHRSMNYDNFTFMTMHYNTISQLDILHLPLSKWEKTSGPRKSLFLRLATGPEEGEKY